MKHCPICNGEVKDTAKFCRHCGNKIEEKVQSKEVFCEECGAKLEPGSTFCDECGAKRELVITKEELLAVTPDLADMFDMIEDFGKEASEEKVSFTKLIDDHIETNGSYKSFKKIVDNDVNKSDKESALLYALEKGLVAEVYEYVCYANDLFGKERAEWFIRCAENEKVYAPACERAGQELISGRYCEKNVRKGLDFLYRAAKDDAPNFLHVFVYERYKNENREPRYCYRDLIGEIQAGNPKAKTCLENIYFEESRKYKEQAQETEKRAESEKDEDKKQILMQLAECSEKLREVLISCAREIAEYKIEK